MDELREALKQEVIKREVIEGDKADGARKKVSKSAGKMLWIRKGKDDADEAPSTASPVIPATPEDQTRHVGVAREGVPSNLAPRLCAGYTASRRIAAAKAAATNSAF